MEIDASEVVRLIESGNPEGLEKLYALVKKFTYFLMRQLGAPDLEDKVHDVFLAAATAISEGRLRDPEKLIPFLTTTTRFYIYGQIDRRVARRKYATLLDHTNIPDRREKTLERLIHEENIARVRDRFPRIPALRREILARFYFDEQPWREICRDMNLTDTQFRLGKSRGLEEISALVRSEPIPRRGKKPPAVNDRKRKRRVLS